MLAYTVHLLFLVGYGILNMHIQVRFILHTFSPCFCFVVYYVHLRIGADSSAILVFPCALLVHCYGHI